MQHPVNTFEADRGDQLAVVLEDGRTHGVLGAAMPRILLESSAGPMTFSTCWEPAEARELGRAIVATADRAEGRDADHDAQYLLAQLVDALEHTNWSSWQSTARFQRQLDAARAFVEQVPA